MSENVTARLKKGNSNFEILVDLDKALSYRKTGQGSIQNILAIDKIFSDVKKGLQSPNSDINKAFGSDDIEKVASEIIKNGEIQLPAEYRKKEREAKYKQIIDFLSRNAMNSRTGNPYPPSTIQNAMEEAGISVNDRKVEDQIPQIIKKLREKLPIKIESKKLSIKIPAQFTGKIYGLIQEYKEKEEWLSDGSLSVIINIPAGMQSEFYDKLNNVTHGQAITAEVKE